MTAIDPNERMALLLGWTRTPWRDFKGWRPPPGEGQDRHTPPDFSQWDRFPELQEYVRGLEHWKAIQVGHEITEAIRVLGAPGYPEVDYAVYITPSMLRDAVIAVVGEEAEVGS